LQEVQLMTYFPPHLHKVSNNSKQKIPKELSVRLIRAIGGEKGKNAWNKATKSASYREACTKSSAKGADDVWQSCKKLDKYSFGLILRESHAT
jgi:hypothetical protein